MFFAFIIIYIYLIISTPQKEQITQDKTSPNVVHFSGFPKNALSQSNIIFTIAKISSSLIGVSKFKLSIFAEYLTPFSSN